MTEHPQPQPGKPQTPEEQRTQAAARAAREGESLEGERRLDPRARILVVEDEHELRELIAQWLESRSYHVVQAADGRDAVDLLEAGLEPDVILLDLSMPRMDGRQFLEWMRASPKHRDRHVIVASGYLDDQAPVDVDLLEAGLEPDVILLDLSMPRMDGRQFLEWMRASPKHHDRHVIVASGYLDDQAPVDVDRTFSKPFRPDLLERELARLASGD